MGMVAPTSTRIAVSVPVTGDGISMVDLVGHDLNERIVALDAVADGLEPLSDDAFGYGFSDMGQFDDHVEFSVCSCRYSVISSQS